MKTPFRDIFFSLALIILLDVSANAEYIFKTDGSIIEGRITADTADSIVIKTIKGETVTVRRSSIMRILYTNIYLGKVYIRMTNGTVKEGYIVDEDRDSYKFRKVLYRPEEEVILRSKTMFIARSNPTDLVGTPARHSISFKWSPPFIPASRYKIYFKKPGEKEFTLVNETSGTSITITGLKSNTKYTIYVTAIDREGIESLPSDLVEVLTLNEPPSAPDNLVKTETITNKGRSVILKWDESEDSDGTIKEYRVFTRTAGDELKEAGVIKKNEFKIDGVAADVIREVRVVAVDDLGASSGESIIRDICFSAVIRPVMTFPFGTMGELWGSGYGSCAGFFVSDLFFNNFQLGIETGYIYWSGCNDAIDLMHMMPVQASIGYRFYFTRSLSTLLSVNGGGVFMSTDYTDAAMQTATKSAFEPLFSGSILVEYSLNESFYLFAGGEFSVIYESSGLQKFAGASTGAGYRFY